MAARKSAKSDTSHRSNGTEPSAPDAVKFLKDEHKKMQKLAGELDKFEGSDEQMEKLKQLCAAWVAHVHHEGDIAYLAFADAGLDQCAIDEAIVEADIASMLLRTLLERDPAAHLFSPIAKAALRAILRAIELEEREPDGVLAKAGQSGADLQALGKALQKAASSHQAEEFGVYPRPRLLRGEGATPRSMETDDMRGNERERDERGRFVEDDERHRGRGYASRGPQSSSRREDDDHDRRGSYASSRSEDDDRRGWYGDSRGHSEASRRGWDERRAGGRDYDNDRRSSRGMDYDEDRRRRSSDSGMSGSRDHGGWYGDSQGHAEASRRGWDNPDHGPSGWYGDREGHSEASRRGWQNADHGRSGWYGDREGHAEASRRGWDERRHSREDDDDEAYRRRRR